jgi:hypothetical protein
MWVGLQIISDLFQHSSVSFSIYLTLFWLVPVMPSPMSQRPISDNIYPEGSLITAFVDPALQLRIVRYYQRIYYCAVVGEESGKQLVYYQRELIPPSGHVAK